MVHAHRRVNKTWSTLSAVIGIIESAKHATLGLLRQTGRKGLGFANTMGRYVFVFGPAWLGAWEGQSPADICSGLTRIDATHWSTHEGPCVDLIDRKVHASLVGLSAVTLAILVWHSFGLCCGILRHKIVGPTVLQSTTNTKYNAPGGA